MENNPISTDSLIETLKDRLIVNAGRLADPILRQGKNPMEDEECYKAFLMLAHMQEIEDYFKNRQ